MKIITTELQQIAQTEPSILKDLAADLGIIADETRLRILDLLVSGEQCVCDITKALELSQPLASYHLAVLRAAGLVRTRRDARWAYYSLNWQRLQGIVASCQQLFDSGRVSNVPTPKARCP
nr:winged helix-turn-helix transcriptional regulator [Chloroflexota bacterium]